MGFCAVDVTAIATATTATAASDVVVYHMFWDITHTVYNTEEKEEEEKNSVRLLSKIFMQSQKQKKNNKTKEK